MTEPLFLGPLYEREHLDDDVRSLVCMSAALTRCDLEGFGDLTKEALRRGLPESAVRECCLQGVAYAGFPRAVAALFAIADLLGPAPDQSGMFDRTDTRVDGTEYFRGVYGDHSDRLLEKIRSLDPNFSDLVIRGAYGRVLSRPQLPPIQRELMGIGSLCVLGQRPQLFAHAAGALRYGATVEACLESVSCVELLYPDTRRPDWNAELTSFLSKIQGSRP